MAVYVFPPITAAVTITGGATEATLANADAKLATIDTSLNNIEAFSTTMASDIADLNDKIPAGLVPTAFDYIATTYVGATTDIQTVTYKTGGAAGTTVAVLTLAYDGSNRLTSVTKT